MTPDRRTCKVISASVQGRGRRLALDLLKLVHELERETDPGAPCDTVVVNSGSGSQEAIRFLDSIEGSATSAGTLTVLHRDGFGGSCGAFHAAYEAFRGRYAYWLFTEDHSVVHAPGYLSQLIDRFDAQPLAGFVALHGLADSVPRYARGAIGLTHATVLDAVYRAWGSLPHRRRHESQDADDVILWGEVLFTTLISRLGYRLIDASDLRLEPDRADCQQLMTRLRKERATVPVLRSYLDRVALALEEWSTK
jgi:hypothetical protein